MPVAEFAVAGNMPAQSTSFIGRRRLLAEVKEAFTSTRLLTLVGPGGVGKTRLAVRAADDLRRRVRDGVWFVDLAGLSDPQLVAKSVASSLGVVDTSGQWPTSLIVAHLASRESLLVLDNCEHLLDSVAVLADVVLKEAPAVRLLATSREPLGISGERVLQVPPLSLGAETGADQSQGSATSEAVALFVARAGDAGVRIDGSDVSRRLVIELCRRLDGMPLAMELAAVRLRTIGLEELLERLNDRFAVLTGGNRAGPLRQRTLRATIDWSYDLLSAPESALLRRIAVFPADFRLDAVEAGTSKTGADSPAALELLASLVDKSFVARSTGATSARYRLHETMRQYALEKLREAGEEDVAIEAFVNFYSELCSKANEAAQTARVADWFRRLDDEADNLRAALTHCLTGPRYTTGLTIIGSLVWYWTARAASEGGYWLGAFLERTDRHGEAEPRALAHAHFAQGFVAMTQGDMTTARPALAAAEATARTTRDWPLVARILAVAASVDAICGELQRAGTHLGEAKTLAAKVDDPGAEAMLALTEAFLALVDTDLGAADRVYSEWAPRLRARGDLQSLSYLLGNHGFTLLRGARVDMAEPVLKEALEIERQLGNTDNILYLLDGLAVQTALAGRAQHAARLLGAGQAIQAQTGVRLMPHMEPLLNRARECISSSLEPRAMEAEIEAGRRMGTAEAIAFALDEKAGQRSGAPPRIKATPLSRRELEVATLVSESLSNKEIASRLFLSERTVEKHVSNIFNRIGVNSRVELASWVAQEVRPA